MPTKNKKFSPLNDFLNRVFGDPRGDFWGGFANTLLAPLITGILFWLFAPVRTFCYWLLEPVAASRLTILAYIAVLLWCINFLIKQWITKRHTLSVANYSPADFQNQIAEYIRDCPQRTGMFPFQVIFKEVDKKYQFPVDTTKQYIEAAAKSESCNVKNIGANSCTLEPFVDWTFV